MPPRTIVKFGSTSATLLMAERLEHPLVYRQELFDVFSPAGAKALLDLARAWREELQARGTVALAAGGEAIRRNAQLQRELRQLFPVWWPLTGEMEGRLAWMAVKARHPSVDGVIDIGGGSTEVIIAEKTWSFAVGAANASPAMPAWPRELAAVHTPAFIGGTAVSLARWANREWLSVKDAEALQQALANHPEAFREWSSIRLRILPQGLAILMSLAKHAGWSRFLVSSRGLTEGLWLAASLGRVSNHD
ncbi:MAG: hypothetical protein OWU84_13105 [Firmicutes bacterium]|nr:hypothetical protein [Bacillota bacterium]